MITRRSLVLSAAAFGSVLLGPGRVLGQGAGRVPRVAVIPEILSREEMATALAASEAPAEHSLTAMWTVFFLEMRRLGYLPGESIDFDIWTEADIDALGGSRPLLEAVLAREPDVIVVFVWRLLPELAAMTTTLPILFLAPDALAMAFVGNAARPERNLTGVSPGLTVELVAKQVQLLAEMTGERRIAAAAAERSFAGPGTMEYQAGIGQLAAAGIEVVLFPLPNPTSFDPATIEAWLTGAAAALQAGGFRSALLIDIGDFDFDRALTARVMREAGLATTTAGGGLSYARGGGLMSYGASGPEAALTMAGYVHRLLEGAQPFELPLERQATYDFGINLETAAALGIDVPLHVLLQATEYFGDLPPRP